MRPRHSIASCWAACIAGCESLERVGADGFVAVVAMKIGPVSARFKGNLKLTNVSPPTGYTINFDGQGGVAGFGRGSADVSLTPVSESATKLAYNARATVGGKMAQIGSRLIDATAGKITDDFFKAFEAQLQARAPAGVEVAAGAPTGSTPALPREPEPAGTIGWVLATIVVLATLFLVFR